MTINYPIIETQLRLIRALQKGYAEALEAGDWQAADYRAAHLQKLCEGLHHLSQLLDKGRSVPDSVRPKTATAGNWLSSIRAVKPTLSPAQTLIPDDKSAPPPSLLPELKPEQLQDDWHTGFQEPQPKAVEEAWQ